MPGPSPHQFEILNSEFLILLIRLTRLLRAKLLRVLLIAQVDEIDVADRYLVDGASGPAPASISRRSDA